jgi:hypothetical protein
VTSLLATPRTGGPRPDPWSDLMGVRALRLGLAGALVLYGGLVLVWALGVPLFGPADERAHVDYAWQVVHGHLPVAGTPFTAQFPELGQVDYVQHVSNHPPLWYVAAGSLLWLADQAGHPAAGLYAVRLANAALTLATVVVVARTGAEVAARADRRTRAAVAVGAALLAAVNPALVAASGAVQNDAPAVLLAALVVLVLARAARTGVDRRTVGLLALLCTLGMLTRVTFLTVTLAAVGAVVALTLWPGLRPSRPGSAALRLALGRAGVVLAAVTAGAGWFLVLNLSRYGDLTGGSAVYAMDSVQDRTLAPGADAGPLGYLLTPNTWWVQLTQLAGPVPSVARGDVAYVVTTVVLTALLVAGGVALVRRRGAGLLDRPGTAVMLLLVLLAAGSMAKLAVHVTNRGGANQRYLLDSLAFWAVGAALLLVALGRLAPYAVALAAALGATGSLAYAAGIVKRTDDLPNGSTAHAVREALATSVLPVPGLLVAGALSAVAAGLWCACRGLFLAVRDDPAEVAR